MTTNYLHLTYFVNIPQPGRHTK